MSGSGDGEIAGCIHFDYHDLAEATKGFDRTPVKLGGCKLGEGGFGPVYRGKLRFTEVAIKILRKVPKVCYIRRALASSIPRLHLRDSGVGITTGKSPRLYL